MHTVRYKTKRLTERGIYMTDIIESKEQQVCNECDRHCPMDDLRCGRGRRAAGLDVSEDRGGHGDREGRKDRGHGEHRQGDHEHGREHGGHGEHGWHGGHEHGGEHGGRGEHGWNGEHRGHGRHFHEFDTDAEGTAGLYARLRQCGHYLFHNGKDYSSQRKILLILSENGGEMTQRELTEELGIHRASVSEVLGKLEKKELITRSQDEQDRRRVQIALTEKGANTVQEGKDTREDQGIEKMFAVLSEEEKNSLYTILGKLLKEWNSGEKCRKKE